jgi:hypothetical protein
MQAEIQKAIDSGKLSTRRRRSARQAHTRDVRPTQELGLRSGRSAIDFLVAQMTIDFKSKKGHPMQLQYGR